MDEANTKPQGNWVPISKTLVAELPHNELRPYTKLEAMYSLTVDYDAGKPVTVRGYAALWRWEKNKVKRFLDEIGVAIIPGKDTKQGAPLTHQSRTSDAPLEFINSRWLRDATHQSRTTDAPVTHHTINPNPKPNPNPKKHRRKTADFLLPDWVPADAWNGFVEMRVKKKKPMTDRAAKLIVAELQKLKEQGYSPGAVLDQSTKKNYDDVYPLKTTQAAPPQPQPTEPGKLVCAI